MDLYSTLMAILKYTVAGIGVVYVAFYLFKPYLEKSQILQTLELKKGLSAQTLPLRLQAYERLVLFVERVNPANMLIRLGANQMPAAELHIIIINEIRNEYQHNVTQQIYVTERAWAVIKRVKEDTLAVVNSAVKALPEGANGLDLGRITLNHLSKLEDNPYDIAITLLRKDLEDLF
ncbi:DUF7935 family protein [Mucilaginibacter psychrotolerans]|uniref:Uncharacterized protein n=1 Tax=Mucilaginibacter psychrotolerans TaxID=1524096 RepID=A0A4Y8SR60_9SPHI|nr:hypothetical protein [Mucilaginibacter psychrotolerans]TFF40947.1 hypothetical protein E2R66_01870 [Mucilaginibacter psychrotolerans]